MKHFEQPPNCPSEAKPEFGYDTEKKRCTVQLPNGRLFELIEVQVSEPNARDTFIRGFCPQANAMGEVQVIEEFGELSVKKVSIDEVVMFEADTMH